MESISLNYNSTILFIYTAQVLAIFLVWSPFAFEIKSFQFPLWGGVYLVSLITAYFFSIIDNIALISIFMLFLFSYFSREKIENNLVRRGSFSLLMTLSFFLVVRKVPGFEIYNLISETYLGQGEKPYRIKLSFEIGSVCLALIGLAYRKISSLKDSLEGIKNSITIVFLVVLSTLELGLFFGAKIDIKIGYYVFFHILINLVFTCILEEVYFRGMLQNRLTSVLSKFSWGPSVSIILISIIFGISHTGGGINFVYVATLAGLGYGYIYNRFKKIEAAIFCHALMNACIFIFLQYPVVLK